MKTPEGFAEGEWLGVGIEGDGAAHRWVGAPSEVPLGKGGFEVEFGLAVEVGPAHAATAARQARKIDRQIERTKFPLIPLSS